MMLCKRTFILAIATVASTAATAVTTVYDDVTALDQQVLNLITGLNNYHGGLIEATPLIAQLTTVHLATRKGYYDSLLLPSSLSTDDATSLFEHVRDTLAVDNPRAVSILEAKKQYFDAIGVTGVVEVGLQVLLSDHLAFSDEVLKRTPAVLVPEGNEVVNIITVALENGIADYST